MEGCKFCKRVTKYGCTLCDNKVCVVCADESNDGDTGYDEDNHRVGKCPAGRCNNNTNTNNNNNISNNNNDGDSDDVDDYSSSSLNSSNNNNSKGKKKVRNTNEKSGKPGKSTSNLFNYFSTAGKKKTPFSQKTKKSDISDVTVMPPSDSSTSDKIVASTSTVEKEKKRAPQKTKKNDSSSDVTAIPLRNENTNDQSLTPNDDEKVENMVVLIENSQVQQAVVDKKQELTSKSLKRPNNNTNETIDILKNKKSKIDESNYDKEAGKKILSEFKKVFVGLDPNKIHSFYTCRERNCKEICPADLKGMSKDKKFQHKWLFDPSYAYCEQTKMWNLVYIDGKGMFCTTCREFDTKQRQNGVMQWNNIPNVRYRTETVQGHLKSGMHQDAVCAHKRLTTSYFDAEEEKKVDSLKNDVYFKVFQSLYWIAKEEMPSSKITSLLTLVEKLGVNDIKHFQTRSEPVLRKMLLLIAKTITSDIVAKIKESDVYGFLTDEVTDISNICQLVSFVKYFDIDKGHAHTVFLDCSDLLNYSTISSPNADAIVECISQRFQELNIDIEKLRAFASDGASVMLGHVGGVAAKLRNEFAPTMINIHCICHRLALACADTGDEYKFIRNVEETLLELWAFFKNSSKRLHIYIKEALKSKQFDTLTPKRKKKIVKRMKKACRTRWLSLHAGVDAAWDEFGGLVDALKCLERDQNSGSKATGLLRKINNYEFLGSLCMLKNMLPILSALSKTFQTGSLNFSRITPSINKSKEKIMEVVNDGRVMNQLKGELNGRLSGLAMSLTEFQESRVQSFVTKYASAICKNITARFPKETCDVLEAFSIFDVDLLPPTSQSPIFSIHGLDEITILAKQFFPDKPVENVLSEWKDFRYELIEMKKKYTSIKKQIIANKLKFKKTSSEWVIEYILNSFQNEEFPSIVQLAKIAAIVPVTNAWPERGASAVKRIKRRMRSTMKNDLLNGLIHISMNGPPVNSKEADTLITRLVEQYVRERHYKVPTINSTVSTTSSSSTQTDDVEVSDDDVESENELTINNGEEEYMMSHFDDESSSSEEEDEDEEI